MAEAVGARPVDETLRRGQPAYLAPEGSTLRLGPHKAAHFAHCQRPVNPEYAAAFPGWDRLDGSRADLFGAVEQVEPERLSRLIAHALTYPVT